MSLPVSEGQIKLAISEFLEIGQAQGKWLYLRLNAGTYVMGKDTSYQRVIRGCKAGTSDFLVIKNSGWFYYLNGERGNRMVEVLFIEVKTERGRQNQAQVDFQKLVESQGHSYKIVRSFEEVQDIFKN